MWRGNKGSGIYWGFLLWKHNSGLKPMHNHEWFNTHSYKAKIAVPSTSQSGNSPTSCRLLILSQILGRIQMLWHWKAPTGGCLKSTNSLQFGVVVVFFNLSPLCLLQSEYTSFLLVNWTRLPSHLWLCWPERCSSLSLGVRVHKDAYIPSEFTLSTRFYLFILIPFIFSFLIFNNTKVFLKKMCRGLPFNLQAIIQRSVIGNRAERKIKLGRKGRKKWNQYLRMSFSACSDWLWIKQKNSLAI